MPSEISTPYDLPPRPARPSVRRPGLMLRARVWFHNLDLDAALAGGADPARSNELALRARQLAEHKTRNHLASGISRLIEVAERRSRGAVAMSYAPFRTKQVQANRTLLLALELRLRSYKPVALQGLALTSLMLENGRGPLRTGSDPVALERAIRAALSALELDADRHQVAPSQMGMAA